MQYNNDNNKEFYVTTQRTSKSLKLKLGLSNLSLVIFSILIIGGVINTPLGFILFGLAIIWRIAIALSIWWDHE